MLRMTLLTAVCLALAACGEKHSHDDHDHDHDHSRKAHSHDAPHGGALVALGDHFAHVEFWLNESGKVFSAFVLDGHAEKPVRIAQSELEIVILPSAKDAQAKEKTLVLKAVASSVTGETVGDTSQFDAPLDELAGLTEFDAKIKTITVKGKTLTEVKFNYPKGNE